MTPRRLTVCCVAVIIALYLVGLVSETLLRHVVQTAPLWLVVVLEARGVRAAGWFALPCFVFWLALMALIWLFLLGWVRVISGSFSTVEVLMTLVVGVASVAGIAESLRSPRAVVALLAGAVLQAAAFWLGMLPAIANR